MIAFPMITGSEKDRVLADELRMLADPMEARSSAKATHPSPDAQKGKLN
jgi:hypothetical protein